MAKPVIVEKVANPSFGIVVLIHSPYHPHMGVFYNGGQVGPWIGVAQSAEAFRRFYALVERLQGPTLCRSCGRKLPTYKAQYCSVYCLTLDRDASKARQAIHL